MVMLLLALLAPQVASDTLVFDVESAFARALEVSPVLEVHREGLTVASELADQAGAWPNPVLSLSAENVGQQRAFTGLNGVAGLEGQAVVRARLPFGPERRGSIRVAEATRALSRAELMIADYEVRAQLLAVFGGLLRDQSFAGIASDEVEALADIAEVLDAQAQAGRASAGDAARAKLEWSVATTRLARRRAAVLRALADLGRWLDLEPDAALRLEAPACSAAPASPTGALDGHVAPEVRAAQARVSAARGAIESARGGRLPDIAPEFGVRRTQGKTGLYLGLSTDLPLFDLGRSRLDAALADERASDVEIRAIERSWRAKRTGAAGALAALEAAGTRFDASWFGALDETAAAAEALYRLGEATLMELLDSRRARLEALDEYHRWQAEWWAARVESAQLDGRQAAATLLCTDPFREVN